jgi:thimet oligopeptidase
MDFPNVNTSALPSSLLTQNLPLHNLQVNHLNEIIKFFPQDAHALTEYVQKAKSEAKQSLDWVSQITSTKRDFNNTFYVLDAAETLLYSRRRTIESLAKTHSSPSFRNQAKDCKDELIQFSLNQFCNQTVYEIYHAAYQNIEKNHESLSREKADYMKWKMDSLRREGLHLQGIEYSQAQALKVEISELESLFLQNIDEDTAFILVTDEELLGVPENMIQSLKQENDHLKKVTCQYPHYFPVMRYCKVEKTRQSLYRAFENRAAKKNVPLLQELIQKREQFARLVGFPSFAHWDISDQLAQTPEAVERFILSLRDGIQNKYNSEIEKLTQKLPEGVTLDEKGQIKPWDLMYLQESYKRQYYHVDELSLQEYFPFERTLRKMMSMFEEMFSLEIELMNTQNKGLWDNPGWVIAVKDNLNQNRLVGHILIDPFPREGKFPHGYCFDVLSPCQLPSGNVNPAIVLLMLNFTPPTDKREAILRHDELVVLFHELGHAFHQLLGNAEMPSRSGYHIQGDALEWPSQLIELLAWEKEKLEMLGEHYETGKPIPKDLLQAKIASKNIALGITFMKFYASSLFSLKCFSGGVKSPKLLREAIEQDFLKGIYCDHEINKEAAFLHLAEHFYRSKFYAYFWADVFAFDTYERITDLLNQGFSDAWLQFRKLVLDHGGGLNPNEAALQFLGRPPSIKSYLKKFSHE